MSTSSVVPEQPATDHAATTRRSGYPTNLLGVGFLLGWLAAFMIGSQLPHQAYSDMVAGGGVRAVAGMLMLVLTLRETSICLLGVLASCLGMWRRRYKFPEKTGDFWADQVSATISGLVAAITALAFPAVGSGIFGFEQDHNTYNTFALAGSLIAFYAGYDENFFEDLGRYVIDWFRGKTSQPTERKP